VRAGQFLGNCFKEKAEETFAIINPDYVK